MNILKQSTAATIKLGPFIDDTDGKTAETALTIKQADVRLSKNGGDFAEKNSTTSATHDENGYYDIPLNATDTGTLGRLRVAVSKSGALPVWQDFLVVTANVYDTLCSTESLDVNVTALADDVITAAKFDESTAFPLKSADTGSTQVARVGADGDTLETLSDQLDTKASEATLTAIKGAGWTDETLVALMTAIENISAGSGATPQEVWEYATRTLTGLPALPTDWVTAASLKADAIAEIQSGLATSAALQAVDDLVDDLESRLTAVRAGYLDKLNVAGTLANTSNADTFKADVTKLDATVSSRLADADYTDPDNAGITAIRAKTDNLPATPANEATLTAIKGAGWTDETLVALMNATEDTLASLSNEIAAKMATAENIEGTYTLKDAIRIILAFAAGKVSGGGTSSIKFRSTGDDVDRIQATVDSSGNRTAVTLNPNDPV